MPQGANHQDDTAMHERLSALETRVDAIQEMMTSCAANNKSLTELQVILQDLVEWRKSSEKRLSIQSETLLKVSLLLDGISKGQEKHAEELVRLREYNNTKDNDNVIKLSDMWKKAFWLAFGSAIAYFLKH